MLLMPPLDRESAMPLYEQIYRFIRAQIENGALEAGDALPSRRAMASLCGVAAITAENAYAQLAAEGFIVTLPKRGTYVERLERLERLPAQTPPARQSGVEVGREVKYNCHFGRIDEASFPRKIWRSLYNEALNETGAVRRGEAQGEAALREALCGYLRRLRGVVCEPSQIVVGTGHEWLLLALLPLFSKTALFGMEDPGYEPYRKLLRAYGRTVLSMSPDSTAYPDVLYLSPSHRFPLGGVMSVKRRQELLRRAGEGLFLLEDDYDSELRYRGLPIPSLQSMDREGRVVYMGSFSNCLSPALRVGYMVLPPVLAERWHKGYLQCGVPVCEQAALARFIELGHLERHIARMRTLYRKRREALLEMLEPLRPRVRAEDDGVGLFIRLSVHNGASESELLERAAAAGIRLTGISRFYDIKEQKPPVTPPRVLFGFGGLCEEELREAVRILSGIW